MPCLTISSARLRRLALASAASLVALTLLAPSLRADDAGGDDDAVIAPDFVRQFPHGKIAQDPGFQHDADLQAHLQQAITATGLDDLTRAGKFGCAIVDLDDLQHPKLAEVQGNKMIYAASIPKIGVLYAAFQARKEGRLQIDDSFRETLTQMCRVSSNQCASAAIQKVTFPYINSVLWASKLYNPKAGGGLWVGKSYGGVNDQWRRDPVANLSHGANAVSLARLLTLLAQDRLVDRQSSLEMKEILGHPGLHHKFVRGLDSRPSTICRKSGSWGLWHGDCALIERGDKRYVAVALMEDADGEQILPQLILHLDDCIPSVAGCGKAPVIETAAADDTLQEEPAQLDPTPGASTPMVMTRSAGR